MVEERFGGRGLTAPKYKNDSFEPYSGAPTFNEVHFAKKSTQRIEPGKWYGGVIIYDLGTFNGANKNLKAGSILLNHEMDPGFPKFYERDG